MSERLPIVIYIAGYGRSGSTILDILLGASPGIFSGGELVYLFEDSLNACARCTCRLRYRSCSVWGPILAGLPLRPHEIGILQNVDRYPLIWHGFARKFARAEKDLYRRVWRTVFEVLGGQGHTHVVDSSKTARFNPYRPLALTWIADLDVRVVHLRRPLHETLRSLAAGGQRDAEMLRPSRRFRVVRGAVGYTLANYRGRLTAPLLGKGRYLDVEFHELLRRPEHALTKIGAFVDANLSPSIQAALRGQHLLVQHNVSGNRLRWANNLAFRMHKDLGAVRKI
jgi:Sulfotransferase family